MPCTREHTGEKPNNLDKGGREKPNKSIEAELQRHSIRQMYNENKSSKHQCVEKVEKSNKQQSEALFSTSEPWETHCF